MWTDKVETIQSEVEEKRDDIIQFLRDICKIPSMDSQLREVGERVEEEMKKLVHIIMFAAGKTIGVEIRHDRLELGLDLSYFCNEGPKIFFESLVLLTNPACLERMARMKAIGTAVGIRGGGDQGCGVHHL